MQKEVSEEEQVAQQGNLLANEKYVVLYEDDKGMLVLRSHDRVRL